MIHQTRPVFLKAHLDFKFRGENYSLSNQNLSIYGVLGIKVDFDATAWVGTPVEVNVALTGKTKREFTVRAWITAERTATTTLMGLWFFMKPSDRTALAKAILTEGFCPETYARQYPRIPALENISSMPLRALTSKNTKKPIAFDILNISPQGVLLYTENKNASDLVPGRRIDVQIDARSAGDYSFDVAGVVKRVLYRKTSKSGNFSYQIGVRFTQIHGESKTKFVNMIARALKVIKEKKIGGVK